MTPIAAEQASHHHRRSAIRPAALVGMALGYLAIVTAIALQAAQPRTRMLAVAGAPAELACPASPVPALAGPSYAGKTLRNLNFAHQDLRNADFSGAVLDGVVFIGANLQGASFRGAKFTNSLNGESATALPTDFSEADLGSTCFIGADFQASAAPVYMTGANLACADFSAVDISRLNVIFGPQLILGSAPDCQTRFRWTVMNCEFIDQWPQLDLSHGSLGACAAGPGATALIGRNFDKASMAGFSFYQAELAGTSWRGAQLQGANFAYADLSNAVFVGAQLGVQPGTGSTLAPANFTGAFMLGADLTSADLRSVTLAGAHIYGGNQANGGVSFVNASLDGADLSGALIPAGVFSGSLTNASFNAAMLVNATFSGANLSYARFNSAYLQGVDFSAASSMNGTSLNNASVATAAGSWSFTEQDGTPYTYPYGATKLGLAATTADAFCPSSETGPCTGTKLTPLDGGPYPPVPACTPAPPTWTNCLPPVPRP